MTSDFEISNNNKPDVYFFWGAKDIITDKVNRWDPEDIGEIVWDDEFDPTSEASQTFLLNLCKKLNEQSFLFKDSMVCWIDNFETFIKLQG